MKITRKSDGKTITIHVISNAAGFRERAYLALYLAEHADRYGDGAIVRAGYDPRADSWHIGHHPIHICCEARASLDALRSGGWCFEDADGEHFPRG